MHWIWDNKQWLFSGVAVAAIAFFYRLLFHRPSPGNSNVVSADRNSSLIGSPQASGSNITQNIHIGVPSAPTHLAQSTNTYSESPTLDEIYEQVKRLPVYQQSLVKDSFLGLKVRWAVKFADLKTVSDAERQLWKIDATHDLLADSSESCGIRVHVDIDRFPRLKVLHKGTPIQVAGEIDFVSDDARFVRLKHGDITFDDFCPGVRKGIAWEAAQTWGDLSAGPAPGCISEIRFDYLPERDPENEGWELVMDQRPDRPTFSVASDPPGDDKCLCIRGTGYRLDYKTELGESSCKTVQYSAKLGDSDASVVYAQVRMVSRDGQIEWDGWIGHKFDTTRSTKKLDDGEWTLRDPGTLLPNTKWRSFAWSLPEEVERTFGKGGVWFYKRLLRIRLRGPLSVTPIRLLE